VGAKFSAPVQTGPGAHPASCSMGTGSFPGQKSGRGVTLTPHPLLVPWSWKGKAIPLLSLWAVRPVQSLSACTRVHFTLCCTPLMLGMWGLASSYWVITPVGCGWEIAYMVGVTNIVTTEIFEIIPDKFWQQDVFWHAWAEFIHNFGRETKGKEPLGRPKRRREATFKPDLKAVVFDGVSD